MNIGQGGFFTPTLLSTASLSQNKSPLVNPNHIKDNIPSSDNKPSVSQQINGKVTVDMISQLLISFAYEHAVTVKRAEYNAGKLSPPDSTQQESFDREEP
jgi:hypothetical protein